MIGHVTLHNSVFEAILQGTLGAMLWSAREVLDGQRQNVDIPAHVRTAHNGLLQRRLEKDLR